jgi:parallel beta-helix repeat protein
MGTGLIEPSQEDLDWAREYLTVTDSVQLNSLALERLQAEQAGVTSQEVVRQAAAVTLGSEVVGRTEAEIETSTGDAPAAAADMASAQALPTAVDNSTLPYFPPIRSQGSLGSCAAFCTTYYTMTYMTAMARGWDVRDDADNTNKFSPKWTYNMIDGGYDGGAWLTDAFQVLATNGSTTWAEFPYDTNCTEWVYDDPAVWRNAIQYRTDGMGAVYDVDTATGLASVKTLLADGYILNYATNFNSWQYTSIGNDPSTSADDPCVGKSCAYWVNGTSGPHGMTVVGYNDSIWVDVNGNGTVDSGEKGAFRIANSWGTTWGEAGFTWLAYDALKGTSAVAGGPSLNRQPAWWYTTAYWITAKASYTPTLLAEFTIQHAKRNQLRINLGTADSGDLPTATWQPAALAQSGGQLGFDGLYHAQSPSEAPSGTFVFDFTDLAPYLGGETTYFLGFNDVSDSSVSGTLSDFRLTDAAGNVLATCPTGTQPGNVPQTDNDLFSTVSYAYLTTPASPIVVEGAPVSVTEGSTASFQVKLAQTPASEVTIQVAWASGDTTVAVTGGSTLAFNAGNWNAYQTVTLSAAEDPDRLNGTALLCCSAPALGTTVTVTALVIDNDHRTYYVNDSSTTVDNWCTAAGSDANDGLSPTTPKATVQAVLDAYTLTAGDVVRIDTGSYLLASNILVTSADSGDASGPVTFEASPYGVVMDRGGGYIAHFGWQITGPYVTITTATSSKYPSAPQSFLKVTDGIVGFYITASNVTVTRCESSGNSANGFEIRGDSVQGVTIKNVLIHGTNANGVWVSDTSGVHIENCTIVLDVSDEGDYYAVCLGAAQVFSCTNSIISVRGREGARAWFANGATWSSDYNDFWVSDGAVIATVPSAGGLGEWRDRTGQDAHSLSVDPCFVDPTGSDFHLQSTAGSYHGGAWTSDALTSCGVDAGYGDTGLELAPNATAGRAPQEGNRNLGAYGGTEQASKTPSSPLVWLSTPATGQIVRGATQFIRWGWIGAGLQPGDTVRLEYSADSGVSWIAIRDAESLPCEVGSYDWNVGSLPTGAGYRVRVMPNREPFFTSQSGSFQIRHGGAITYYVNDSLTSHDLWCTAPGSPDNDGSSPATPKCDLGDLVSAWDIEPGDRIFIDTGFYNPATYYSIDYQDVGDSTGRVTVSASPYGVTVDFESWGEWLVGSYVTVNTADSQRYPNVPKSLLKIRGSYKGFNVYGESVRISGCDIYDAGSAGIFVNWSQNAIVENCVVEGGSGTGISINYPGTTIRNCTVFDNTQYGIYVASGAAPTLENNIVRADGAGCTAIYVAGSSGLRSSDYNDIYATNGALLGHYVTDCTTLSAWQASTGVDQASISVDPLLANAATGDAHLCSTGGRYDTSLGLSPENSSAWVVDTVKSPCIDAGNPTSAYSNEPSPNGGRINMGAYGNTSQASRSYLNSVPVLDVDGNGTPDALTDGILILRYLFDPAGAWNYSDALGANATRTTRESLKTYLDSGRSGVLDVDGNGTPDALTDGILILRYLFDPAGDWNYSDALGTGATRTSRSAIRAYLDLYNPTAETAEFASLIADVGVPAAMSSVDFTTDGRESCSVESAGGGARSTWENTLSVACVPAPAVSAPDVLAVLRLPATPRPIDEHRLIADVAYATLPGDPDRELLGAVVSGTTSLRTRDAAFRQWETSPPTTANVAPPPPRLAPLGLARDDVATLEMFDEEWPLAPLGTPPWATTGCGVRFGLRSSFVRGRA